MIPLSPEPKRRRPLVYRFRTPYLFYPLRAFRRVEGYTWIQMLTFVSRELRWARSPQFETAELFTKAGYVEFDRSREDLAWISGEMAHLLGDEDPRLHVWHFGGDLGEIDQDMVLPGGYVLSWNPSPP